MPRKPNNRDFGMPGAGAGKGDSPRYKHNKNWDDRFSLIIFKRHNDDGFKPIRVGHQRKSYGPKSPPKPNDI